MVLTIHRAKEMQRSTNIFFFLEIENNKIKKKEKRGKRKEETLRHILAFPLKLSYSVYSSDLARDPRDVNVCLHSAIFKNFSCITMASKFGTKFPQLKMYKSILPTRVCTLRMCVPSFLATFPQESSYVFAYVLGRAFSCIFLNKSKTL